jgi:hypothetical protein
MGGKLITDPSRLSVLSAMHAEAIEWINAGQVIPVERTTDLSQHNDESLHEHDKRVYQVIGLLGVQLLTTLGLKNLEKVLDALLGLFKTDDIVWESRERCRAFFSTHGGGNEILRTYAKDHGNPTAENKIK